MKVSFTAHLPQLVEIGKVGSSSLGYLSIVEDLPFAIKRVYWTYYAPHDVIRGHHAHKALHQLIVGISGDMKFEIENINGQKFDFKLDQPHIGLYIPPLCWRTMKFSHNAVLLCLASEEYDENDYIRNYNEFEKLKWN